MMSTYMETEHINTPPTLRGKTILLSPLTLHCAEVSPCLLAQKRKDTLLCGGVLAYKIKLL